mmetsp:Transcript_26/g.39  ORF Transcript_26/g.39 Transcript_26/m.39 type:complete len:300 (-) Transcript_26:13-912(-)
MYVLAFATSFTTTSLVPVVVVVVHFGVREHVGQHERCVHSRRNLHDVVSRRPLSRERKVLRRQRRVNLRHDVPLLLLFNPSRSCSSVLNTRRRLIVKVLFNNIIPSFAVLQVDVATLVAPETHLRLELKLVPRLRRHAHRPLLRVGAVAMHLQQFLPDDFVPFSVSSFHSVHHLVVVREPGALFPHLVQRLGRCVHTAQRKYFPLLAPGQELATGLIHGFAVLVQVQHVEGVAGDLEGLPLDQQVGVQSGLHQVGLIEDAIPLEVRLGNRRERQVHRLEGRTAGLTLATTSHNGRCSYV